MYNCRKIYFDIMIKSSQNQVIQIKQINNSDIDELVNLNKTIFANEIVYDRPYIALLANAKKGYILKEHYNLISSGESGESIISSEKSVGYILYNLVMYHSKYEFTIVSLGILKEYRGKGYGKKLLQYVVDLFPEKNIALNVRATNITAQNLYKSVGFQLVNIDKNYYHQLKDDGYHMMKYKNKTNNLSAYLKNITESNMVDLNTIDDLLKKIKK